MADREKVIKGLERFKADFKPFCGNSLDWARVDAALALMKEQEPIAPVVVSHSRGIAYNCGACGTEIAVIKDTISADWQKNSVRYCQRCGRAVK